MSKVIMGHNLTLYLQDESNPLVCATQCQLQLDVDMLEIAPTANGTAREFIPVSTSYIINADGYLPAEANPCERKVLRTTGLPSLVTWTMQVVQSYSTEHGASIRVISGQTYLSSQTLTAGLASPAGSHITLRGSGAINEDTSTNIEDIIYQTYLERLIFDLEGDGSMYLTQDLTGGTTGYGGSLALPNTVGAAGRPTPGIRISMSYVASGTRHTAPFLESGGTAGVYSITLDKIIRIANGQATPISFTVADDGSYIDFAASVVGEYWFFFTAGVYKFIDHITYHE